MIGKIICWWKDEHNWSDWSSRIRYGDARTYYWVRICRRCKRIESTLKEPK